MLNKLVSKQHLQGLSCLLQAHLLNDSTKTWPGALVVTGLWVLGLMAILMQFIWGGRTTVLVSGQVWATALQQEWSPAFLGERRQRSLGVVVSIEVQGSRGQLLKCHLYLGSHLPVFFHPGTISSLQKMSYISYLQMCINTICVSVEGERDINIYICVCIYICKYMYVLYTQNLSIH